MEQSPVGLWRLEFKVPTHVVEAFEEMLAPLVDSISWFPAGDIDEAVVWHIEAFRRERPDFAEIQAQLALTAASLGIEAPALCFHNAPMRDWVTENLQRFPPLSAGRFFIHGSHFEGRPPSGSLPLQVDAGLAFGSGEHASTRGCLLALDRLARSRRFQRPLDMGCGSGILAMAMAKVWAVDVLACDIDLAAVRVAAENARINRLSRFVRARQSDGYASVRVGREKFDIVTANILARPLCRMAADLGARLEQGGVAVLSGLLARQERQVLAAHRRVGLHLIGRVAIGGWHTLILS